MTRRSQAVVLIDGPALVHRWYHRWNYSNQKQATPIDVTKFAIRNARHMIAQAHSFDPSHLAQHLMSPQLEYSHTPKHNKIIVCFDHGDGGRRAVYAEYKKNRDKIVHAPELLMIEKVVKHVFKEEPQGSVITIPDFDKGMRSVDAEADDMIATIALYTQTKKIPTVVVSHDYDLYQLIDNAKKSYHYDLRTKHLVSDNAVKERIGVRPDLVRDFKSLAGDSSDNIPGIKGIGKARACSLLQCHGNLDGVLSDGPHTQKGNIGKLIREGADMARISSQLVDFRMCPTILKYCEPFISA